MVDDRIVAHLERRGLRYCLIGAAALAARGYARFTADVDLLTVDRSVLLPSFWAGLELAPELREGQPSDPLVGVVRWEPLNTDLVVGKGHAARFAVETAERLPHAECPVPTALAIVLNKLEAGELKDQQDIAALVEVQRALGRAAWLAEVPAHLPQLSPEARALWARLEAQLSR